MKSKKSIGIVSIIIAAIGIIVILSYRAWLGGLIFLIAGMIADYALRAGIKEKTGEEYPNYVLALITEKKVSTPKYVSEGLKSNNIIDKILSCIIASLPFMVVICVILWIIWDTNRSVDEIFSDIY